MHIKTDIYDFMFDETSGSLTIARHGQAWRSETGDNALLALMQKCEELAITLHNIIENCDEIEHDYYSLAGSEDFNPAAVLTEARKLANEARP